MFIPIFCVLIPNLWCGYYQGFANDSHWHLWIRWCHAHVACAALGFLFGWTIGCNWWCGIGRVFPWCEREDGYKTFPVMWMFWGSANHHARLRIPHTPCPAFGQWEGHASFCNLPLILWGYLKSYGIGIDKRAGSSA